MKKNLEDIIAASICKFNVEIDINGQLAPSISTECCDKPCEYCKLVASYICKQIEEGKDVDKQSIESHR